MNDGNKIQPVDFYVKSLLEYAKEEGNVEVDVERPTRGQRLEVAMYLDRKDSWWEAMEVMIGMRVGSNSYEGHLLAMMKIARVMESSEERVRKFYDGLVHRYSPETESE